MCHLEVNRKENVDFTFDPEELAGKSYVITQDLYFDKAQDAGTVFDDETADVYAVLYSDGTLSFQKRKIPTQAKRS